MNEYDGKQFVGIDLHRQRSVIVRQSESGEQLSAVRIVNDPALLRVQVELAGVDRLADEPRRAAGATGSAGASVRAAVQETGASWPPAAGAPGAYCLR